MGSAMISDGQVSAGIRSSRRQSSVGSSTLPPLNQRRSIASKIVDNESDVLVATITHCEGGGLPSHKVTRTLVSDLRKKKNKVKAKSRGPVVDTSKGKSNCDVVRVAIKDLGWRDCPSGRRAGCAFYWLCGQFEIPQTPETGYLNKFPGMSKATHKIEFSRQLERMKLFYPESYSFYPKTWTLPDQYSELLGDVARGKGLDIFIVKPDGGSQGEGIFLMNNPLNVHLSTSLVRPVIVQEYITEPYLLEKFKFDLRIYVVLKSLDPLGIYICREGMARLCTQHYRPPSPKNMNNIYMHLTNYSLNKNSSTYVHSDADDKGSKRKLSAVFQQLADKGHDVSRLWLDIDGVICKTIIALVPLLKLHGQLVETELKLRLKCFQILGFDILLDKQLHPILLEVNSNPSMSINFEEEIGPSTRVEYVCTTDLEIKMPLVRDALQLVWQSRSSTGNVLDAIPESVGCLQQIYPKLAPEYRHIRTVERCLTLFRHFIGVRVSDRMGPTSFRMLARQCRLTDFGYTLAAMEILFINTSQRHSSVDNPRASLNFNSFCEALLTIGRRKQNGIGPQNEPIYTLLTVLRHCEAHLDKSKNPALFRQRFDKQHRGTNRAPQSCFRLPTGPPIKEGIP